ncbi:hypothetical protein K504DRAFT_458749, partial [Pleomassaria siparia CBS 279.74]
MIRNYKDCQGEEMMLLLGAPPEHTILLSMAMILLTVAIEIIVHKSMDFVNTKGLSVIDESYDVENPSSDTNTTGPKARKSHTSNPSPTTRINRLTMATLLFMPLCVAFGFRLAGSSKVWVSQDCKQYVHVNWGVVFIINFVPFITASSAWLRSLIDCTLIRGRALQYPSETDGFGWPPALPFYATFYVIRIMMKALVRVLSGSKFDTPETELIEGRPETNFELSGEETELLNDIDGAEDDHEEFEDPPTYDSSWDSGRHEEGPIV